MLKKHDVFYTSVLLEVTWYEPLYNMCIASWDLNVAQMNVQHTLIWELMLYKFKPGYNAAEATKNICSAEGEAAVDCSTITRCLKKFHLG